jgi:hypothetical protein
MKRLFAAAALLATFTNAAMAGDLTLFADSDFRGGRVGLQHDVRDLSQLGFNDRASSMVIRSGVWQLCEHRDFGGHCAEFGPGEYRVLPNFNDNITSAREIDPGRGRERDGYRGGRDGDRDNLGNRGDREGNRDERGGGRGEGVQLFTGQGFSGERAIVGSDMRSMEQVGLNDRAASLVIREGRWEFCEHVDFRGQCMVLGPGEYGSLDRMTNTISSMRRVR